MNVFVLSTGRCGPTTFSRACSHIENYTSSHESRIGNLERRIQYPNNHIEVDNRLSFFLGRLENLYGDDAFYVHLRRDRDATAESFLRRYDSGIIAAYRRRIVPLMGDEPAPIEVCRHYCDTINANIEGFLRDKSKCMEFWLETSEEDFQVFWEQIGTSGERSEAINEWSYHYNASKTDGTDFKRWTDRVRGGIMKMKRVIRKLPGFLKRA
jgi:hypothetical protein